MRLTFFRDALAQSLLVGTTNLDLQAYRPAIVFLNGEYWGIHNLRERMDGHYLAAKYQVEREDVVILEISGSIRDGDPGDQQHYSDMLKFLRSSDITNSEIYSVMTTLMDMENYIDYQVAQIYFGNTDWPFNNIQFWRYKTEEFNPNAPYGLDGRWRWMVYDTDYGFGLAEPPDHDTLKWATSTDEWATVLFRTLLKNPDFRTQFINRFADHLNSTFAPERVLGAIEPMKLGLEPEMAEHIHRWPYISSLRTWERNINVVRDFARRRPDYVREHIVDMFKLPGTAALTVTVSPAHSGTVLVNSIEMELSFNGVYFLDIPIDLVALPAAGYAFVGWRGGADSESPILNWLPKGDMTLEAVFAPLPGE
jgi:hypothetical protein